MASLDDLLWLVGDEDCGVGIDCRTCDRGGAALLAAAVEHAAVHA